METRAHHVLVGAFTLLAAALALLFGLWAGKALTDYQWDEYEVVFTEAVTGLGRGGVVQYSGIVVGEVQELALDPADPGRVIVRIRVESNTPIKTDTTARLAMIGLTGITQLQLRGGSPGSPRLREVTPRGQVPRIAAEDSPFAQLLASSETIITTANDVLLRLDRMLDEETVGNLQRSIAHLEQLTGSLAGEREQIAATLRDARSGMARLDRLLAAAEGNMDGVGRSVALLDRELPGLLQQLDRSLAAFESFSTHADAVVVENRAALRQFGQGGLPQAAPALAELRRLLRELEQLTSRIEEHPRHTLFGGTVPEEFTP